MTQQNFKTSLLAAGNFTHSVYLSTATGVKLEITKLVKEIKSISYKLNYYASAEIILQDKEKVIFNEVFFTGTNQISIQIVDMLGNVFSFAGVPKSFHPIDIENDLYSLSLYSFFDFQNIRNIRVAFSGSLTVSEIIKRIINDKKLFNAGASPDNHVVEDCDPSVRLENFIVPNWNFYTTIQYLKQFAQTRNGSIFFFFEDRNGLNFISKDTLLSYSASRPAVAFRFSPTQVEGEVTAETSLDQRAGTEVPFNVVYEYKIERGFDISDHLKYDDFGQKLYVFNYKEKKLTIQTTELTKIFNKMKTINSTIHMDASILDFFKYNNTFEYTEVPDLIDTYATYHLQKNLMKDYVLKIRTNGMLDFSIGQLVTVNLPSIAGNVIPLSGKWMVVGIDHRVELVTGDNKQSRLSTTLTLARDSINMSGDMVKIYNMKTKNQLVMG